MPSSQEEIDISDFCFVLLTTKIKIRKLRRKQIQDAFKNRMKQGVYHNLLQAMQLNGRESHFR